MPSVLPIDIRPSKNPLYLGTKLPPVLTLAPTFPPRDALFPLLPREKEKVRESEIPVRYRNSVASAKGLTGIVVGDQAPFTHRLTTFDVKHVYIFLRKVEEYYHNYGIQVQVVSFVDQNILDAILSGKEHGRDLPAHSCHQLVRCPCRDRHWQVPSVLLPR